MLNKVLFTSPFLMYPPASGPHLRIENSIKALARISELHVISQVGAYALGSDDAVSHYRSLVKAFSFTPSCHNLSKWRPLRRVQIVTRKALVNDAKHIVQYAKKHQIKVIWFGFGNLSYALMRKVRSLDPDLKLICDTDSVWSRFIFRELPFVEDEAEKRKIIEQTTAKEQEEKAWVNMCDITTAVSEVDAQYYRFLTEDKNKVAQFSNVLDLADYPEHVPAFPNLKKPAIYLAGSFGKETSAMNRAAIWLLNDILPLVKKQIPNVHCYIVGNYSDVAFGHIKDTAVTVTGKVPSVLPILKNIDVALTPLQFESGTRFKILEAGACKVPMVSTTLGAEGLPVIDGEHILIADTSEDFANAIVKLIEDKALAAKLAQNSYNLVREQFSVECLAEEAKHILKRLEA